MLASQGYPESPRTGDTIEGLTSTGQSIAGIDGTTVFHAGTGRHTAGGFLPQAAGGRIGSASPPSAHARSRRAPTPCAAAALIEWEGMQLRHDIAAEAAGSALAGRESAR